ncbi:uncharacterized protein LOC122084204 isoform X5 [Macadamia integrifolia]|uniref:uncharacterized protein LOC122084204 isoform X5 n=1 Tax=Macadamia integrifolia TaxID=60698 RepID=UPI001C4EC84C|nr:uncharacterized protein LOC122084204 isoform X5 [Macadamia integrifolia]
MELAVKSLSFSCLSPKVRKAMNRMAVSPHWLSLYSHYRASCRFSAPACAVSAGLENVRVSASPSEDFSITTTTTSTAMELKIKVDVYGAKTQAIFDDVFSEMVSAAQPIPGFRRVKGGKTPNEGLKVTSDLRVHQSFEELESTFEPGETFSLDAVIQLQGENV